MNLKRVRSRDLNPQNTNIIFVFSIRVTKQIGAKRVLTTGVFPLTLRQPQGLLPHLFTDAAVVADALDNLRLQQRPVKQRFDETSRLTLDLPVPSLDQYFLFRGGAPEHQLAVSGSGSQNRAVGGKATQVAPGLSVLLGSPVARFHSLIVPS